MEVRRLDVHLDRHHGFFMNDRLPQPLGRLLGVGLLLVILKIGIRCRLSQLIGPIYDLSVDINTRNNARPVQVHRQKTFAG